MSGGALEVDGVAVSLDGAPVLHDASLRVPAGGITAVVGPSGSGKSTLLRAIAGLVGTDRGTVRLDGVELRDVPTHRRGIGLVAQHGALFPHRDVGRNVAFGLGARAARGAGASDRVAEVLDLVGLAGFERRSVASLSGGERQRVALARALAPRPSVLLLDEPLAALDRGLRERLVVDLGRVLRAEGTSALHVTHDQQEAATLADELVVLRAGRTVQHGAPGEVYDEPCDAWVATFLGHRNVVPVDALTPPVRAALGGLPDEAGAHVLVPEAAVRLDAAVGVAGVVVESHRAPARPGVLVEAGGLRLWVAPGEGPPLAAGAAVTLAAAPGTIRGLPGDAPAGEP